MQKMKNERDDLGDRMKRYEATSTSQLLIPNLPLYARIDGRHFSSLTSKLGYPYLDLPYSKKSTFFTRAMSETAKLVAEEFNADVVENHSDEISLGWTTLEKAPFDGKLFKIITNISSYTASCFLQTILKMKEDPDISERDSLDAIAIMQKTPSFDCRAYQVPNLMELANCFVWRQNDCIRGTINQYARCWFSHKQLNGKSQRDRIEMLAKAGHDIDDVQISQWFTPLMLGTTRVKRTITGPMPEQWRKFHPNETTVTRRELTKVEPTKFANMGDKVGFFFPDN